MASRLTSLPGNPSLRPTFATPNRFWQSASNCTNTVSNNCHGRWLLAYAKVERAGASGNPRCLNFPSLACRPSVISRNDFACASWQNIMTTNCPQLLNPRACRSAWCCFTAASNLSRGINWRIWLKMLHTRFMVKPPWFAYGSFLRN